MPSSLSKLWEQIASDLNLVVDLDFTVPEGRDLPKADVRLRSFGGPSGMLLFEHTPSTTAMREYSELGYGFSVLRTPGDTSAYNQDEVLEMLSDWGFTGSGFFFSSQRARPSQGRWLWTAYLQAATERSARKLLAQLQELFPVEIQSVQLEPRSGGFRANWVVCVPFDYRAELVCEALSVAQTVGRSWTVTGAIEEALEASTSAVKVQGIEMLSWRLTLSTDA